MACWKLLDWSLIASPYVKLTRSVLLGEVHSKEDLLQYALNLCKTFEKPRSPEQLMTDVHLDLFVLIVALISLMH